MTRVVETFCNANLEHPIEFSLHDLSIALYTHKKREHDNNEDSVGFVLDQARQTAVLAVADGVGGHAQGEVASKIAITELISAIDSMAHDSSYQGSILDAFERANQRVLSLNSGAGTTLIVMEFTPDWVRYYCAGDSAVEILGGKGKTKYRSIGHGSLELAIESGVIESPDERIHDDLRHTITNLVGSKDMRIEIGGKYQLDSRDIVVLGSDGLFDNVQTQKVLELVKPKTSLGICTALVQEATKQMYLDGSNDLYSKPDDLSLLVAMKSQRRSS